jgi:hypothetical protein
MVQCRHSPRAPPPGRCNEIRVVPIWCNAAFRRARRVQPPVSPFSVAPIWHRSPIDLLRSPFTSHTLSGHINPMTPFARPPVHAPPTAVPSCAAHPCCRRYLQQIRYPIHIFTVYNIFHRLMLIASFHRNPCALIQSKHPGE